MVHKAVVVAAGYGTRLLPVTRVVPKELLPLGVRPALDVVVDELVDAGITDLLVITSRRKRTVEDWFDRDPELEDALAGRPERLVLATPRDLRVTFVRQDRMGGTGHAILLARAFAGDDPVVVAFPDDVLGPPNATAALIAAHRRTGAAVLGVQDLSGQDVSAYGVVDGREEDGLLRVRRVVEKPQGTPPSHWVSVGRYLYTPRLLDALEAHAQAPDGAELTPMPAMNAVAADGDLVAAPLTGRRWDTGSALGYLQATIDHALDDSTLGPALAAWLARHPAVRDDG